jgi:ABC-type proline/glycine betaine transport system permease subunit
VISLAFLLGLALALPRVDQMLEAISRPLPGMRGQPTAFQWTALAPVFGSWIGVSLGVLHDQRRRRRPAVQQVVAVMVSTIASGAVLLLFFGISVAIASPLSESPLERFLAALAAAPPALPVGLGVSLVVVLLVGLAKVLRVGFANADARIDAEMEEERRERADLAGPVAIGADDGT